MVGINSDFADGLRAFSQMFELQKVSIGRICYRIAEGDYKKENSKGVCFTIKDAIRVERTCV